MRRVYLLKETPQIVQILNETYEDLFAAAKHRNPKVQSLIEDEEFSQLHDLLVLLRLGYLKVKSIEDYEGCPSIAIEISKKSFRGKS